MTGTGGVALLMTMLAVWATGWYLATLLALYLRPACAEDDAGSGRWLPR